MILSNIINLKWKTITPNKLDPLKYVNSKWDRIWIGIIRKFSQTWLYTGFSHSYPIPLPTKSLNFKNSKKKNITKLKANPSRLWVGLAVVLARFTGGTGSDISIVQKVYEAVKKNGCHGPSGGIDFFLLKNKFEWGWSLECLGFLYI